MRTPRKDLTMSSIGRLVVDTSFLIAYLNRRDRHHEEAVRLSGVLENYHVYITDYIFDELVTFFAYRVGRDYAVRVAEAVLRKVEEGEVDMVMASEEVLIDALDYLRRYERGFSFTDCVTLAVMDKLGVDHILTFDSDFDGVTLLKSRKRVVNIRYLGR